MRINRFLNYLKTVETTESTYHQMRQEDYTIVRKQRFEKSGLFQETVTVFSTRNDTA
jgi:hypothetical protein